MDSNNDQLKNDFIFKKALVAEQDYPTSALYVIGLPIGNFSDITLRALWVLSICDVIAAEDTRETGKLLQKFNLSADIFSLHQHTEQQGAVKVLNLLREGKRVALVTDVGTPAISDPGAKVVALVREQGFRVIPIPGPCAVVTALSAAGMAVGGFIFHGFLDGGAVERIKMIEELCKTGRTFALYEAPHRIVKLAEELAKTVPSNRKVVLARELTKKFEEIRTFQSAADIPEWFAKHPPKGEFVIIVNAEDRNKASELDDISERWINALLPHLPTKVLSDVAGEVTGIPKKQIYRKIIALKNE